MIPYVFLLNFILTFNSIYCWEFNELELFDLVEEINENFYDLLSVPQSAETSEIRKAYRKLSAKLHPDKNKDVEPDVAEKQFRQLVSVYEVLKDEESRKRYDEILEFGLPDWRQPVFYYRRVRKLGLVEISLMLLLIVSVGHFIVIWAAYLEKRFEMEEVFKHTKVKKDKKSKKHKVKTEEVDLDDILEEALSIIPRPTWYDFLPIKISVFSYEKAKELPTLIKEVKFYIEESFKRKEIPIVEEIEEKIDENERKMKRRMKIETKEETPAPVMSNITPVCYSSIQKNEFSDESEATKAGKAWSDEDLSLLTKAMSRVPSGTLKRWEKIAELIGRTAPEVISKSKELKAGWGTSVPVTAQGISGSFEETVSFKKGKSSLSGVVISERVDSDDSKTNSDVKNNIGGNKIKKVEPASKESTENENCSEWSQTQQQVLEWAMKNYPKGTSERWEKIAENIDGKTKEDCMLRFKYLAELVKKRKQEKTEKITSER